MRARACWSAAVATLVAGAAYASPPPSQRERVELGRRLFMDPAVSLGGRVSCASCHDPEHGFSDPRRVSVDEDGPTRRHSQTLIDVVDGKGIHWDGEFDSVRELLVARLVPERRVAQALELFQRRFDAALASGRTPDTGEFHRRMQDASPYGGLAAAGGRLPRDAVARRVARDGYYKEGFRRAFGASKATTERIVDALEAYVLSIRSGESAYDRNVAGDTHALGAAARRGLALFTGKANCASCHPARRFTDGGFHNTGVGAARVPHHLGGDPTGLDGGLGMNSFVASDLGSFKTPGLRDVARRGPYMHDGSLSTLADVVAYYNGGGTPNARLDPRIRPLGLGAGGAADLVAFLEALTSDVRPGRGGERWPARTTVLVHDVFGHPIRGMEVEVRPFGDRLSWRASKEPLRLATDGSGALTFEFPQWTHVVLAASGTEIGGGRPIPDYVRRARVLATSRRYVVLRILAPGGVGEMPSRVLANEAAPSRSTSTFRRVRGIRGNEALYVTEARPEPPGGKVTVMLDFRPKGGVVRPREIDLSGGETEPIDLRE